MAVVIPAPVTVSEAVRIRTRSELRQLLGVLRKEAGRLALDARRFDERGFRQLAAELREIRERFVRVIAASASTADGKD